eukprot:642353-Hanusia_phi.AAC.2
MGKLGKGGRKEEDGWGGEERADRKKDEQKQRAGGESWIEQVRTLRQGTKEAMRETRAGARKKAQIQAQRITE